MEISMVLMDAWYSIKFFQLAVWLAIIVINPSIFYLSKLIFWNLTTIKISLVKILCYAVLHIDPHLQLISQLTIFKPATFKGLCASMTAGWTRLSSINGHILYTNGHIDQREVRIHANLNFNSACNPVVGVGSGWAMIWRELVTLVTSLWQVSSSLAASSRYGNKTGVSNWSDEGYTWVDMGSFWLAKMKHLHWSSQWWDEGSHDPNVILY